MKNKFLTKLTQRKYQILILSLLLLISIVWSYHQELAIKSIKQTREIEYKSFFKNDITKSPLDHRGYKFITLDNGLKVMLIFDNKLKMASVAMNVNVGSKDNPKGFDGLAHLLEHSVFLGSDKYPNEESFKAIIEQNSGFYNAYTSFTDTNYSFQINYNNLIKALDIFAQMFISPLLEENMLKKEVEIIDSEYNFYNRKKLAVLSEISNPKSAYHQLSVGNKFTLADQQNNSLHKQVVKFFNQYYIANNMALAVVVPNNENLIKLENFIRGKFNKIKSGVVKKKQPQPLFTKNYLPSLVKIKNIGEQQTMSINFVMPSYFFNYKNKPMLYISKILDYEGSGSLSQKLLDDGIINKGISVETYYDNYLNSIFSINFSLTNEGLKNWKKIASMTFGVINKIKKQSINLEYSKENETLNEIFFYFNEVDKVAQAVNISTNISHYNYQDALSANFLFKTEPKLIRDTLNNLVINNMFIMLSSKNFDNLDRHTKWYNSVEFSSKKLSSYDIKSFKVIREWLKNYKLPPLNKYISPIIADKINITSIKNAQKQRSKKILAKIKDYKVIIPNKLLINKVDSGFSDIELWQGYPYKNVMPKGVTFYRINIDDDSINEKTNILLQLFVAILNRNLSTKIYSANEAGIYLTTFVKDDHLEIAVQGYNYKQEELLKIWLESFDSIEINEETVNFAKEKYITSINNQLNDTPIQYAYSVLNKLLKARVINVKKAIELIENVKVEDLLDLWFVLSSKTNVKAMIFGNYPANYVQKIVNISTRFNSSEINSLVSKPIKLNGKYEYQMQTNHSDNLVYAYFQAQDMTYKDKAIDMLLAKIINELAYDQLKSQQEGYIAGSNYNEIGQQPGLIVYFQSNKLQANNLVNKVFQLLKSYKINENELNNVKNSLKDQLSEPITSVKSQAFSYWKEINHNNLNFDSKMQIYKQIGKIHLEDINKRMDQIVNMQRSLFITTGETSLGLTNFKKY